MSTPADQWQAPTAPLPPAAGLGDPSQRIESLPPLQHTVAGVPVDPETGEPHRPGAIFASTALFSLSALVAAASYWFYWYQTINLRNTANFVGWWHPRPGSGSSVVMVCIMAALGLIFTFGPAIAAYNTWTGSKYWKGYAIAACVTGLFGIFFFWPSLASLLLSAVAAGVLFLPSAKKYFERWHALTEPEMDEIQPPTLVEYGPMPRFQ